MRCIGFSGGAGGTITGLDASRRLADVSNLLLDSLQYQLKTYAKSIFLRCGMNFVTMRFSMLQDTCKMAQDGSKMASDGRKLPYIGALIAPYGLFFSQDCDFFRFR